VLVEELECRLQNPKLRGASSHGLILCAGWWHVQAM